MGFGKEEFGVIGGRGKKDIVRVSLNFLYSD